jgi:MFS family permease
LRGLVQERFDVSEFMTSLFMSINMVGAVCAAPAVGVVADRFGRRVPLIVAAAIGDGVLLLAMTADVPFGVFMGLRFLEGCAHIAALSLVLSLAANGPEERRGRTMGLVGSGIMMGVALGAPIGGALGREDPLLPLYIGSAFVLVAAAVARGTLVERNAGEARPSAAEMIGALREHRRLLAPLAFAFADRFTVGFYTTTFSLYLSRIHDFTPGRIGLQIMLFMLPFALLSYPFGRFAENHSRVRMLCVGSLVYGVLTISLTFWSTPWLPVAMVALGIASAVMFVPTLLLTTELAPPEIRSTALGAFNSAGSLGFIVGPAAGGLISQTVAASEGWALGYRAAFSVAGISEIVCVAVALPLLVRLVRQRATQ